MSNLISNSPCLWYSFPSVCQAQPERQPKKGSLLVRHKDRMMIYAEDHLPGTDKRSLSHTSHHCRSKENRWLCTHHWQRRNSALIAWNFATFLNTSCYNQVIKRTCQKATCQTQRVWISVLLLEKHSIG